MQTTSYTIPSHTIPGTYYTVTVFTDGDTRCTCPDATYRHRQCKHQRQVIAGALPPQRVGQRGAEIAAANDAASDAIEFNTIIRGW